MATRMGGWGWRRAARAVVWVGIGLFSLHGCAATPRKFVSLGTPVAGRPRLALLPLENLSGRPEAGDLLTRMLFVELVRSGGCELVESGNVDTALDALHVRATGSLSSEQLRGLGDKLGVRFVLTGSVLESGTVRTPEGEVPSVGVALKLLEVRSARVAWAGMRFRSGEDKETVFGWGRQRDAERLAAELVAEVLADFRIVEPDTVIAREGKTP